MKKKYRFLVFIAVLLVFSFSGEAQFRKYLLPKETFEGKSSPKDPEENPFEFEINFTNFNELFRLEAASLAFAQREYNRWLANQHITLLEEINRQLGTRHTNFKTAKNDFFHNYEKNRKRIERVASTESWKLSQKAEALTKEKNVFLNELYLVKEAQRLYDWCKGHGYGSEECNKLSSTTIRGFNLGRANRTTLNGLHDSSVKDFSPLEVESAQNQAWATGVRRIIDDHSLLNTMVDRRIRHFDELDTKVQVYLMINYLSGYYSSQSPLIYQIKLPDPKYRIPLIWHEKTIVEMGKKRAPELDIEVAVFGPNYIAEKFGSCMNLSQVGTQGFSPEYCFKIKDDLTLLKEEIIQEYVDDYKKNLKKWYLDKDGDGYHSEEKEANGKPGDKWKTETKGKDCDDDDAEATIYKTWYLDNDGDGFYSEKKSHCTKPGDKWKKKRTLKDCDDNDPNKKTKGDCFELNDPCANKDLRNKEVSREVKRLIKKRVRRRGRGRKIPEFSVQEIEDGEGDINADLYELDITKLPNGITAQQLFEDIRGDFTEFVIGGDVPLTGVNLMSYSSQDGTVWNSSNPIGAAMDFDTLMDTSTVITTEYSLEEMFWTFTTVRSIDHLGHFVSGHRQFRLRDNGDGSFTFEVRGSDRLGQQIDKKVNNAIRVIESDLLFKYAADATWKNLMEALEKFIKAKPGAEVKPFDRNKEYGKRHPYNKNDCK